MAKSAAPLLIGAGAIAVAATKKKKKKKRGHWGIYISKDCQNVEITNSELFRKFVLGATKELIDIDPNLDILQVTDSLYGEVAPHCSPFPENPESPLLAELYKRIVAGVTDAMIRLGKSEQVKAMVGSARAGEFSQWYAHWRNPPSSQIPDTASSDVAFASDYSQYRIGNDWYAQQVVPFVEAMAQAGATQQTIYDEFLTNRAVLLGRFYIPIADMPKEQMVVQFLKQIQDAILKAFSEMQDGGA